MENTKMKKAATPKSPFALWLRDNRHGKHGRVKIIDTRTGKVSWR